MFSGRILGVDTSELREVLSLIKGGEVISFAGGVPSKETFPLEELREILLEVAGIEDAFQYGPSMGIEGLRQELQRYMKERHGINAKPEEIMITHGSQQGIDIVGRVFVDPGDTVIVEAPTYFVVLNTFQLYEPHFVQVRLEEDGLKTEELEATLRKLKTEGKKVKILYTIPTFQNPSGITMSEEKRKHLVELAEEFDFIIIEDNAYGDLRYEGKGVKAIKHFDESGRVIYLGTFSKIFVPGFRLAWLVASDELMERIEVGKMTADVCSNTFGQYVAWKFMEKGFLERHIAKLIEFYRPKRDAMLDSLEEFMPENVGWTKPDGGMFVWATIEGNVDTKALLKRAIERKVAYVPGAVFYALKDGKNQMRLNFTFESVDRIREGIKRLAELISSIQ